jgi:CRP/FNR family transcriptional regulator
MINKLKSIYLFEKFSSEDFDKLVTIAKLKKYQRGNIIFYEGDESNDLHILISGEAQVYKNDYKSNRVVMHNFSKPSLIAEVANLDHIPFPATCEATTNSEFILIDYKKFEEIFFKDPLISIQIIKSLTKKIKSLENTIDSNLVLDATSRVAKYIYQNNEEFKKIKNRDIAQLLNIKPETLSRILKKFKESGLIDKDGTILEYESLKNMF